MYKRLLLLNGLAIFAVVVNHAGGWGQIGLFWWADQYRSVVVPDWTQLGSLSYYFLLLIRQIALFSVPAFFFVSGFFVSYAALDKRNPLNWAFVWKRIKTLLIPYLIWSIVVIVGNLLQGISHSPHEYMILIVTIGVVGPYWFVPALCYSYLISPVVVRLVQWNWKLILMISGLIQLIPVAIGVLGYAGINLPLTAFISRLFPSWSPFQWIFFFTFGISAGFHVRGLHAVADEISYGIIPPCFANRTAEYTRIGLFISFIRALCRCSYWNNYIQHLFNHIYFMVPGSCSDSIFQSIGSAWYKVIWNLPASLSDN